MNDPFQIDMRIDDDYCQGYFPNRYEIPQEDLEEEEVPELKFKPIRIKRGK